MFCTKPGAWLNTSGGGVVGILVGLMKLEGALAKEPWKTQTYGTRLVKAVSYRGLDLPSSVKTNFSHAV